MTEVKPQMPRMGIRLGKERLTGHERHVLRHGWLQQGAGIQRLLQGQPEEEPALGDFPIGQFSEVLLQRDLHGIAALTVEIAQLGQVCVVLLGT